MIRNRKGLAGFAGLAAGVHTVNASSQLWCVASSFGSAPLSISNRERGFFYQKPKVSRNSAWF